MFHGYPSPKKTVSGVSRSTSSTNRPQTCVLTSRVHVNTLQMPSTLVETCSCTVSRVSHVQQQSSLLTSSTISGCHTIRHMHWSNGDDLVSIQIPDSCLHSELGRTDGALMLHRRRPNSGARVRHTPQCPQLSLPPFLPWSPMDTLHRSREGSATATTVDQDHIDQRFSLWHRLRWPRGHRVVCGCCVASIIDHRTSLAGLPCLSISPGYPLHLLRPTSSVYPRISLYGMIILVLPISIQGGAFSLDV